MSQMTDNIVKTIASQANSARSGDIAPLQETCALYLPAGDGFAIIMSAIRGQSTAEGVMVAAANAAQKIFDEQRADRNV